MKAYRNKRITVLLAFVLLLTQFVAFFGSDTTAHAAAETKYLPFMFTDFENPNQLGLISINGNGAAVNNGIDPKKVLRLAPASGNKYGTIFNKKLFPTQNNFSFSTYFTFRLTNQGGLGADGITFTIQTQSSNAGISGGGLGYSGITPSFAVKYDSYQNSEYGDPSDSYIGLAKNGSVNNVPGWYTDIKPTYNMKDGHLYHTWIDYDGLNQNVKVYINRDSNKRDTAMKALDLNGIDLGTIFQRNANIYAGLTSSTGGAWENHDIGAWYFSNQYDPIDINEYQYKQIPEKVKETIDDMGNVTATVYDYNGDPVGSGFPVEFSVSTGAGTFTKVSGTTDANGQVSTIFTLNDSLAIVRARTVGGAYDEKTIALSAPVLNVPTAGDGQIDLSWSTVTGATYYKIYQRTAPGSYGTEIATVSGSVYSYTALELTNGATYYYIVKAVHIEGDSLASNEVNATPQGVPVIQSITAGDSQASLNWRPVNGATGYKIYQGTTPGSYGTEIATVSGSVYSYTSLGLTNGTTYYYVVKAVNAGGLSPISNEVNATPKASHWSSSSSTGGSPSPTQSVKIVLESNPSTEGKAAMTEMTKLVGTGLSLSAQLLTADGKPLDIPALLISPTGELNLPNIKAGEYKIALSVVAPTGEKLAGRVAKLTVDSNGSAKLESDLIDPYGLVTDAVTGEKIEGAKTTLYWSNTELNRSKGRKAGDPVVLPELPDFAPNKNHNPQASNAGGQYGWMVFPDGDYYIISEKDGYDTFDSRKNTRDEQQGTDSYIRQGNIHVGQTIVTYDFKMQPQVIDSGEHQPYMVGYPDGEFKPERGITRAEVAAILSRTMSTTSDATAAVSYADVDASHWAADAIALAAQQKWMAGYGGGNFGPEKQVTRAELVQALMNVKHWSATTKSSFSDVIGHWAEDAIAAGKQQGVLTGYPDGTFHPDSLITRSEAIVIFNKVLDRHPWKIKASPKWPDVPTSYWNYDAIMEASIPHKFEKFKNGIENWK